MKRAAGENGAALLEVLLSLALVALILQWAVPEALRIYKYNAVRFEAEHLLSELRYEQMLARTGSQKLGREGRTDVAGDRPKLLLTGTGYRCYRGRDETKRHTCLPSVRLKFNDSWDGRDQTVNFYANGNIYPNVTIKVFSSGQEGISCRVVMDAAGRFRLERDGAGG